MSRGTCALVFVTYGFWLGRCILVFVDIVLGVRGEGGGSSTET